MRTQTSEFDPVAVIENLNDELVYGQMPASHGETGRGRKGTTNYAATAAYAEEWAGKSTYDSVRALSQSRKPAVTGMRFWLLLAALWFTLTATFLVWLTLINAPGGRYAFGGVLLDRNLASPYLLVIAVTLTIAASIIVTRRRRSLRQTPPPTSGN